MDNSSDDIRALIDSAYAESDVRGEQLDERDAAFVLHVPSVICTHNDIEHEDALFAVVGNGFTVELTPKHRDRLRYAGLTGQEIVSLLVEHYGAHIIKRMFYAAGGTLPVYAAPADYTWGPYTAEEDED